MSSSGDELSNMHNKARQAEDYCVDMCDQQKCERVFHINMLKKWQPAQQPEGVNLAEQVD